MQRTDGDGSFEIELIEASIETGLRGQTEPKLEALGTIDVRVEEVQRGGEPRSALVVTFSTGPAAAGRSCESVISLSPDIPKIMETMRDVIVRAARSA